MATGFRTDAGNPAAYSRSAKWDTPWAQKAYKSYDDYTSRMKKAGASYQTGSDPLSRLGSRLTGDMSTLSGKYGGIGRWGTGIAAPDDPMVGGYMNNLRGGIYNTLNDASRSLASAGVASSRGGYGVAGGTPADAAARQEAMQTAARGYGDNYSKAMGWTQTAYGNLANNYNNLANNAVSAYSKAGDLGLGYAGAERSGIEGANSLFAMRSGDYDADMAAQQAYGASQASREREQMDWETQRRNKQHAQDQSQAIEGMQRRAAYGPFTGYASPYSDLFNRNQYLINEGQIQQKPWGGKSGGVGRPDATTAAYSRQMGY